MKRIRKSAKPQKPKQLDLPLHQPASRKPAYGAPPAADPMKTARKLNPKGHTE